MSRHTDFVVFSLLEEMKKAIPENTAPKKAFRVKDFITHTDPDIGDFTAAQVFCQECAISLSTRHAITFAETRTKNMKPFCYNCDTTIESDQNSDLTLSALCAQLPPNNTTRKIEDADILLLKNGLERSIHRKWSPFGMIQKDLIDVIRIILPLYLAARVAPSCENLSD
jgi:hypothetical protein